MLVSVYRELSDASSMYLKGFMDASAHPGKGAVGMNNAIMIELTF